VGHPYISIRLIGVDWNRSCIMNTFRITLDDLASIWMVDIEWSKNHKSAIGASYRILLEAYVEIE
jgi:hypothetical protein